MKLAFAPRSRSSLPLDDMGDSKHRDTIIIGGASTILWALARCPHQADPHLPILPLPLVLQAALLA